ITTDLMSLSQFHPLTRLHSHMHGLIFETSISLLAGSTRNRRREKWWLEEKFGRERFVWEKIWGRERRRAEEREEKKREKKNEAAGREKGRESVWEKERRK